MKERCKKCGNRLTKYNRFDDICNKCNHEESMKVIKEVASKEWI